LLTLSGISRVFETAIPNMKLHINALMGLNRVQMAYPPSAMTMAKMSPGMFSENSSVLNFNVGLTRLLKSQQYSI